MQNKYIQTYTIESPPIEFNFEPFVSDPAWCETAYDFEINGSFGLSLVTAWDDLTRTFIFEYYEGLALLDNDILTDFKDYTVTILATTGLSRPITTRTTFTLRLQNPCADSANLPVEERPTWCPTAEKFETIAHNPFWNPYTP